MSLVDDDRNIVDGAWWVQLDLSYPCEEVADKAVRKTLSEYVPVSFAPAGGGEVLSLAQLAELLMTVRSKAEEEDLLARAARRAADVAEFEASYAMPDADALVEEGAWAGFTRAEATAWCWNLFQYEPVGFISPGSMVRADALAKLRAGELPEVFGYPARARRLVEQGTTARMYREYRQALGSRMFDSADVVWGRPR